MNFVITLRKEISDIKFHDWPKLNGKFLLLRETKRNGNSNFVRLKSSEATNWSILYLWAAFFMLLCWVTQHFICYNNAIVNLFHVLRVIHFRPLKFIKQQLPFLGSLGLAVVAVWYRQSGLDFCCVFLCRKCILVNNNNGFVRRNNKLKYSKRHAAETTKGSRLIQGFLAFLNWALKTIKTE